jgi:hypothetical protein
MKRMSGGGVHLLSAFVATAMLTSALGWAATAPPPPDLNQLLAAGFKVVVAKTKEQQEHLRTLPPGQVTGWQRTGKHFFVYPDPARNQLYVGTPKEYEAYRRLVPNAGPTPTQQHAADMASYLKEDATMQMYTKRDLADPYYFWDDFEGLGWK